MSGVNWSADGLAVFLGGASSAQQRVARQPTAKATIDHRQR